VLEQPALPRRCLIRIRRGDDAAPPSLARKPSDQRICPLITGPVPMDAGRFSAADPTNPPRNHVEHRCMWVAPRVRYENLAILAFSTHRLQSARAAFQLRRGLQRAGFPLPVKRGSARLIDRLQTWRHRRRGNYGGLFHPAWPGQAPALSHRGLPVAGGGPEHALCSDQQLA